MKSRKNCAVREACNLVHFISVFYGKTTWKPGSRVCGELGHLRCSYTAFATCLTILFRHKLHWAMRLATSIIASISMITIHELPSILLTAAIYRCDIIASWRNDGTVRTVWKICYSDARYVAESRIDFYLSHRLQATKQNDQGKPFEGYVTLGHLCRKLHEKLSRIITPSEANYHSLLHSVPDNNSATRASKLEALQSLPFSILTGPQMIPHNGQLFRHPDA